LKKKAFPKGKNAFSPQKKIPVKVVRPSQIRVTKNGVPLKKKAFPKGKNAFSPSKKSP